MKVVQCALDFEPKMEDQFKDSDLFRQRPRRRLLLLNFGRSGHTGPISLASPAPSAWQDCRPLAPRRRRRR
eukprot:1709996-Heterocapsa_arctica.AAC.1